jgi:hypothetical protein
MSTTERTAQLSAQAAVRQLVTIKQLSCNGAIFFRQQQTLFKQITTQQTGATALQQQ